MKKISTINQFVFAMALSLLVACQANTKQETVSVATGPLTVSHQQFSQKDGDCTAGKPCATFDVRYPVVTGNDAFNNSLQKAIQSLVATELGYDAQASPFDSLAAKLFATYKAEMRDMPMPECQYAFEMTDSLLFQDDKTLTFSLMSYQSTCGAHPNHSTTLWNYDPKSGAAIDIKSMIQDENTVLTLLDKKFKKDKPDVNYLVEKLVLPANMGIVKEGILFYYNPYEVTAYAFGDTPITLTWEELGTSVVRK